MATNKTGIDQDALIQMFAEAGARQSEALRQAVAGFLAWRTWTPEQGTPLEDGREVQQRPV